MLFSEPKIPQWKGLTVGARSLHVSVLFSEPKIPQSTLSSTSAASLRSFSALQRAENSSIDIRSEYEGNASKFQCSSASRKFLNQPHFHYPRERTKSFSALQRAENSSIRLSRALPRRRRGFSALQRAENSSIIRAALRTPDRAEFQCSSASRKFLNRLGLTPYYEDGQVSVLFSEPKIPQLIDEPIRKLFRHSFSALQRAENSSIDLLASAANASTGFSALQRAENSSIFRISRANGDAERFSALQRAENSSIPAAPTAAEPARRVSVLFSEPKIPQSRPSHLRPSIFPTATITLRRS